MNQWEITDRIAHICLNIVPVLLIEVWRSGRCWRAGCALAVARGDEPWKFLGRQNFFEWRKRVEGEGGVDSSRTTRCTPVDCHRTVTSWQPGVVRGS